MFLKDADKRVRFAAGTLLIARGTVTEENVRAVQKTVLDGNINDRREFVSQLRFDDMNTKRKRIAPLPAPGLVAPALIALLESTGSFRVNDGPEDRGFAVQCFRILGMFAQDEAVRPAIPLLSRAAQGEFPVKDLDVQVTAAVTLGKFGSAAREALPALISLRARLLKAPLVEETRKIELFEIDSAIAEIEAKK